MRAVRVLTNGSGFSTDQPWLPGLLHIAAALATCFVFGAQAFVTGLLLATLASFVVFLPLTALALNGGKAITENMSAPALTAKAQLVLFGLWTLTAWGGAALAG
jgi:hypothetical protein